MNAHSPSTITDSADLDALGDRIAALAAGLDAATHQLLRELREFDALGGWCVQGTLSCVQWLGWKCGITAGPAREKLRVAHALGKLPLVDEQLRLGQLSFSKVRAMTRVATAENEAQLVDLARHATAAQLEKMCRLLGQCAPRPPVVDDERRWLRLRDQSCGLVRLEVQLRPEEAARVVAACDVFAKSARERVDGLITMAEATLRGDAPDRPAVEVVVHVDAETLTGSQGATGVSAETSRRLLCDAGVVPVSGENVGRKRRVFAGALRRALFTRDGGCRFPGCTHTRYLHAHHIRHWVNGGETTLANALTLCTRHHTLVHEGGFRVVVDEHGTPCFFRPDGRRVEVSPRSTPRPLPAVDTLPPTWDGGSLDYGWAVESLL